MENKLGKISCVFTYNDYAICPASCVIFGDAWLRLDYQLGYDAIKRNPETKELELDYIPFDYQ